MPYVICWEQVFVYREDVQSGCRRKAYLRKSSSGILLIQDFQATAKFRKLIVVLCNGIRHLHSHGGLELQDQVFCGGIVHVWIL